MAATTVDTVMAACVGATRPNCPCMAAWRGYAHLLLDKTTYVGTGQAAPNRAKAG